MLSKKKKKKVEDRRQGARYRVSTEHMLENKCQKKKVGKNKIKKVKITHNNKIVLSKHSYILIRRFFHLKSLLTLLFLWNLTNHSIDFPLSISLVSSFTSYCLYLYILFECIWDFFSKPVYKHNTLQLFSRHSDTFSFILKLFLFLNRANCQDIFSINGSVVI